MRIPKHIGIIPDGNRRWSQQNSLSKEKGYDYGLNPGLRAFRLLQSLGVEEITFYGFTKDNTKRPKVQRLAFSKACVDAVKLLAQEDVDLLVMGDYTSNMFPQELNKYTTRKRMGKGGTKLNFLVNYSYEWDLEGTIPHSKDISRVDMIIRWGGMCRLSGFLPLQSVYSDFYVIDDLWPDYKDQHILNALGWYQMQDVTLGG